MREYLFNQNIRYGHQPNSQHIASEQNWPYHANFPTNSYNSFTSTKQALHYTPFKQMRMFCFYVHGNYPYGEVN